MRGLRARVLLPVAASFLFLPAAGSQEPGLPPEWELRKDLRALAEQTGRLKPLLEAVKTEEWIAKGAPQTYGTQWKAVVDETGYAIRSAGELEKEPDRLTLALETYLRLQSLDAMLVSLSEGVSRYQNPALADLIRSAVADGAPHRERLRQYVVQLAALMEAQFKVVDQEAQRCRTKLVQQPTPARGANK